MSNLSRIDPAAVAAWFEAHPEIRPVRQSTVQLSKDGEKVVALCGLASQGECAAERRSPMIAEIADSLGLGVSYACGFLDGWDGFAPGRLASNEFCLGNEDGRAAYAATTEALR